MAETDPTITHRFDVIVQETLAHDLAAGYDQLPWSSAPQAMKDYWMAYAHVVIEHLNASDGWISVHKLTDELRPLGDPLDEWSTLKRPNLWFALINTIDYLAELVAKTNREDAKLTRFTDAFGAALSIGDEVVFVHKSAHSRHSRGSARYVRARITGTTEKMLVVQWLSVQQLAGPGNDTLTQPPHEGHWNPELCVRFRAV